MKKIAFLVLVAVIISLNTFSQKNNLGISVNALFDMDWNKPLTDLHNTYKYMTVLSKFPIKFGITYEREYKIISPSISLNFIYRNIKYSEQYTPITNFNHFTVELPINLSYRKPIGTETSLLLNVGGGINYIITPTDKMKAGMISNNELVYSFSIVNPKKINAFINGGIGMECALKKIGTFQFKLEYYYQFSKQLQYQYTDIYPVQFSNSYRLNYASIGLVYYLPVFKKSEL